MASILPSFNLIIMKIVPPFKRTHLHCSNTKDSISVERRIKMILLLPNLLLRKPPGLNKWQPRAEKCTLRLRLSQFTSNNWIPLLIGYKQDIAFVAANFSKPQSAASESRDDTHLKVSRAVDLIADNQCGRARKALLSNGMGDPLDTRVQAQLQAKHPTHKEEIPPMTNE
jgi:hypothetical protein